MRLFPLLALACFGLAACEASAPVPPPEGVPEPPAEPGARAADSTEARFEELYAHWRQTRPDAYTFTYEAQCFCLERGPFTVTVENGQVAGIDPADAPGYRHLTLDSLYQKVADAFAQDAASVRYEYDPQTRLLASFFIDYSEQMADEEFGAVIEQVDLSR